MSVQQLEQQLREVNAAVYEMRGAYLCIGGTFGNGDAFDRGAQQLLSGATIISPVCFHNSYWSRGQIERDLIALSAFGDRNNIKNKVHVFLVDGPAQHNYAAIGITEDEASARRKRQLQQLGQGIDRGIDEVGEGSKARFSRSNWEQVSTNPALIEERSKLEALYAESAEFRKDIESLTREVLSSRYRELRRQEVKPETVSGAAVKIGKNYTLDEMAFVAASPRLLGVDNVCFTYHKDWPVFRKWADGAYDGQVKPQYGFIVIYTAKGKYDNSKHVVLTVSEATKLAGLKETWTDGQNIVFGKSPDQDFSINNNAHHTSKPAVFVGTKPRYRRPIRYHEGRGALTLDADVA